MILLENLQRNEIEEKDSYHTEAEPWEYQWS